MKLKAKQFFKRDRDDDKEDKPIPFIQLFKYASTRTRVYIAVGLISAFTTGTSWPVITIYFGYIVDIFVNFERQRNFNDTTNKTVDDFLYETYYNSGALMVCGLIHIFCVYLTILCFIVSANNQIYAIRVKFFRSVLSQEIAWFDQRSSGDFASRITADLKKIEDGIGEKLALCINAISSAIISIVVAFYYGWKLTLAVLAITPIVVVTSWISSKIQAKCAQKEIESYAVAGGIAEEVLSAIRTVFAFGGEEKEAKRYEVNLFPAMRNGIKRNFFTGLTNGILWCGLYAGMALGTWYGVKLILDGVDGYTPGLLVIIFWCVLAVGYCIGNSAPHFEAFQIAKGSAKTVFDVIERQSILDPTSKAGEKLKNFESSIKFVDVHFAYPSRKSVKVLNNFNLNVNSGETIALVGPSGCGKSTIIQLLQRFYDTDSGDVIISGCNITDFNLGWLREQIGVVGQEPVLFDATIEENILLGLPGGRPDGESRSVQEAAVEANAHEFISRLPNKYQTLVGDRGAQLSGGQKQRIAIARALISQPKILLLDEATSALDLHSESLVQAALDRASMGRTTIIVAHRLSTVKSADRILYMEKGEIKEIGTHEELMQLKGLYYNLVNEQENQKPSNDDYEEKELINKEILRLNRSVTVESSNSLKNERTRNQSIDEMTQEDVSKHFSQMRLLRMLGPDKYYVIVGIFCAVAYSMSTPIYAYIFGEFLEVFTHQTNVDIIWRSSIIFALCYLAIGVGMAIATVIQMTVFGVAGERLTLRLRKMAFSSMLRQEIAWFDQPDNGAGSLCARLASDAANVQGASGSRMAILSQAFSTFVVACLLGFGLNWKIALLNLAFFPFIVAGSVVWASSTNSQLKGDKEATEKAAKIAVEAISSIRTVASLHQEDYFYQEYAKLLENNLRMTKRKSHVRALALSLAMSINFFTYGASFIFGGHLVADQEVSTGVFFKIIETMIYGAIVVGQSAVFTSDYAKAKIAAANIFKLIDRQSPNSFNNQVTVDRPDRCHCDGRISLRGVQFTYPNRPGVRILKGLSFDADQGQTVALVGSSGCGKSTVVQLLERFYDASQGQVLISGKDVSCLSPDWLRSQMSLVSQEPVLFSCSIRDNIAYGDNRRSVSLDEVVEAAQKANIHRFIVDLPMGYDTAVGSRGTQLSGGQKQRIAIARALVRNPLILLLDEATSALDSTSEKVVQSALDSACVGRTCLVIAHRLNTIKNADKIVVIQNGVSVEEGTHEELMARNGAYFKLYNVQSQAQL